MKSKSLIVIVILGVVLVGTVIAYLSFRKRTQTELSTTKRALEVASFELVMASNAVDSARSELSVVRSNMQTQVEQLQLAVSTVTSEKIQAEEQAIVLNDRLTKTRAELADQKQTLATIEQENRKLMTEMQAVSQQLAIVDPKLSSLETTHATTLRHLTAIREEYVALVKAKAEMEAMMNDPKSLRGRLRRVRQDQLARRADELRRESRSDRPGNNGYVMKSGSWAVAPNTSQYPLVQEIRREE